MAKAMAKSVTLTITATVTVLMSAWPLVMDVCAAGVQVASLRLMVPPAAKAIPCLDRHWHDRGAPKRTYC